MDVCRVVASLTRLPSQPYTRLLRQKLRRHSIGNRGQRPAEAGHYDAYGMSKPSDLVQGTLDLLILKILDLEPLHGWAVSQRLNQVSGAVLQVSDGSLYPALHKLEQQGWITAEWKTSELGRRAKFYSLTQGRTAIPGSGNGTLAPSDVGHQPGPRAARRSDAWNGAAGSTPSQPGSTAIFRTRRVEKDLDDELAFHVAMQTRANAQRRHELTTRPTAAPVWRSAASSRSRNARATCDRFAGRVTPCRMSDRAPRAPQDPALHASRCGADCGARRRCQRDDLQRPESAAVQAAPVFCRTRTHRQRVPYLAAVGSLAALRWGTIWITATGTESFEHLTAMMVRGCEPGRSRSTRRASAWQYGPAATSSPLFGGGPAHRSCVRRRPTTSRARPRWSCCRIALWQRRFAGDRGHCWPGRYDSTARRRRWIGVMPGELPYPLFWGPMESRRPLAFTGRAADCFEAATTFASSASSSRVLHQNRPTRKCGRLANRCWPSIRTSIGGKVFASSRSVSPVLRSGGSRRLPSASPFSCCSLRA